MKVSLMPKNGKSQSVFAECIADSLKQHEPKISPPTNLKSLPAGRLLYWLTHHWKKATISVREICVYGPQITRNRKSAIDLAETLAQRGFLLPIRTHRIDRKVWLIVRETEQIGTPCAVTLKNG
jgi:hypothetical protein